MEELIKYRSLNSINYKEITENEIEKHIVEGYAIVFNSLSANMGNYREKIMPEAVTEDLINRSDIYFLYNHNGNMLPLARSNKGKGSLRLKIDEKGLYYEFECLNDEFYKLVKRGDLDMASFAFSIEDNEEYLRWVKSQEYNYICEIIKIKNMYDCSTVLRPAYNAASTNARSLTPPDEVHEEQEKEVEVKPIEEQPTQEPEKQVEEPVKEEEPEPIKEEEKEIDYSEYDKIINSLKK